MREAARRAWRAFSGSLSAKVFAGLFCLLSAAGLALYAVVAAAFPQSYDAALGVRTDARIAEVGAELERLPLSEGVEFLSSWCAQTGFVATLSTDERSWTFGNVGEATSEVLVAPAAEEDDGEPLITAVSEVSFADGASGMLALIGSPADEAFFGEVFQGLLPPVLLLIAAVSAAGAWLVSRLVARPIVEVSGISQRLAALDFTWRCPEGRRDEVGALGRNLNAMAEDLARAMEDLERANERLTREMEAVRALAGERKAFFAAAGHELKTPLAVMRAQVEGMQLGIGDFADHGKHLPRVLAAVERMEALVRDILEASRLDAAGEGAALAREPVDVAAAVRAAVAEVEPLARERGVTFEVRVEGEAEAAGGALGVAAEGAALADGDASAEGEASPPRRGAHRAGRAGSAREGDRHRGGQRRPARPGGKHGRRARGARLACGGEPLRAPRAAGRRGALQPLRPRRRRARRRDRRHRPRPLPRQDHLRPPRVPLRRHRRGRHVPRGDAFLTLRARFRAAFFSVVGPRPFPFQTETKRRADRKLTGGWFTGMRHARR